MREKPWYPVLYMFVITAFFSTILIGLSRFTRDRVEANQRFAYERAVLQALPVEIPPGASSADVHRIFVERLRPPSAATGGAYVLEGNGGVEAYAVPLEGQGFWDTIAGVIGVREDRRTVTGISFYEQKETPGLGAEIVKPAFRDQFDGLELAPGPQAVRILPVSADLGRSDVHAVTGATQTSTRLEKILNEALTSWREALGER